MLAAEVVRQGELACEKTRGRRDGVVSRWGYDQPAALFDQLDLAPGFEPQLAPKLPRNKDLSL
jgi:hypothetical protein